MRHSNNNSLEQNDFLALSYVLRHKSQIPVTLFLSAYSPTNKNPNPTIEPALLPPVTPLHLQAGASDKMTQNKRNH